MAKTYTKVGTVLEGEYGPYIVLGNAKAKNDKFKFDTKLRIERPGQEPLTVTNCLLKLQDPRKIPGNKYADKVHESVKYEIVLVQDDEKA